MREIWDRYISAIAIVVLSGVTYASIVGREAFCSSEQEHCLREWISATSGWFAVFAAFVTILYLARQIDDANTQHREALRADAEPKLLLAQRVDTLIDGLEHAYAQLLTVAKNHQQIGLNPTQELSRYEGLINTLKVIIDNPDMRDVERAFAQRWAGLYAFRGALDVLQQRTQDLRSQIGEDGQISPQLMIAVENLRSKFLKLDAIADFCRIAREGATMYLRRWDAPA
ncbi:hypothetical protein ACQKGL_11180 [Ensifer adhaerens]|uniref:hypothetical protein n=1 Tax=Ensifer adhaerens TaxID=106592 RepID=UPI003CFE7270